MIKKRTWGQALDAANARDSAEGTNAHGNAVVLGMLHDLLRKKEQLAKAKSAKQLVVFQKPKPRPRGIMMLFRRGKR